MKHTKLWSCLIAFMLLISCAAGIFAVGAVAESATVYYTIGSVALEGAENFADINTALAQAEKKSGQWAADDVLEIQFKGTISGGAQDGLLFGQTTIWREDGTKLPIIIRGVDTSKARDAFIYVDSAGGWYACANDYHFRNLTIPVANQSTDFYAGCGNISFEDVYFSNKDVKIRDAEDQKIMTQLIHDVARTVSARNNAALVPAGDAWQDLLDNNPDVGFNLWYSKKNPYPYGDYQHDGDLGGGQYLNACVWYEVLTKKSCVGNTWRPTEDLVGYTLDEAMITVLQNAAHDAVVAHYGESYYDDTYSPDTVEDNELNILVIGSSTGYYFPDEVSQLLNADGITSRVGMAYHSGVRLETQWSWKEQGTGDYAFRLYEKDYVTATVNSSNGALMKGVGFDSFMELYDWDAIGIYQAPGAFDDVIELSAYDRCLATCDVADDLYAFYKETNPEARYLWYQGATKALGYPGVADLSETSGRFFGDNCTQAVFEGWPELKAGERVQTSITFGPGTQYYSSARKHFVAAIGYMDDYEGAALTEETAKDVTYMEAVGAKNVADIRPIDVDASIIIDGEDCRLYNVAAHLGHAPSNGTVHLKRGTVQCLDGDNRDSSVVDDYYGDMTLKVSGGHVLSAVYGTYSSNVVGDLTIDISEDTAETTIAASIRGTFDTGKVTGDVRMSVRGGTIQAQNDNVFAFYGGGNCTGEVVNTISGGTLEGTFFGVRTGSPKKITNNFIGGVINADVYGGAYGKNATIGCVTNNLSGTTINGNFYGGGYSATGQTINAGSVIADGKEVQAPSSTTFPAVRLTVFSTEAAMKPAEEITTT